MPRLRVIDAPQVLDVALEAHITDAFHVEARPESTGRRQEADFVRRYAAWLERQGSAVTRKKIRLPGLDRPLYADLFEIDRAELVEAKNSASRDQVRCALRQLLDYARHVEHRSAAVLLPVHPGQDLVQLLHSQQITCIIEQTLGHFIRLSP